MKPPRAPRAGPASGPAARWGLAGALVGLVIGGAAFAPAAWVVTGVSAASGGRLLLAEARGTVWNGSAIAVLTGGPGSRDASALPGRLAWSLAPRWAGGLGMALQAEQACCLNGVVTVLIRPGIGGVRLELLPGAPGWIAQWPSAWLAGLGTPFNTLQLGGQLRLQSPGLALESVQGRWRLSGRADLDMSAMSSRLSTLPTLGDYRLSVDATPDAGAALRLTTLGGALQLQGDGQWSAASGLRLRAQAQAATADDEAALGNLLNIIGRRQGARSVISIG